MDFIDRFRQYSKVQQVLQDAAPVLLAVSGGVDSMVLLHLFQTLGLPFGIAHCNFQLRAAESEGDAQFVQATADKLGVPFFVERFDTKKHAASTGMSTQMAARDLRYRWFAEIAEQYDYQKLATAHNLNDAVETTLLNFIRGTGLAGLSGMVSGETGRLNSDMGEGEQHSEQALTQSGFRPSNASFILRPLLFATRNEILAYAKASQVSWREDSSNASDNYKRNYLRHHIIPPMVDLNPNFLQTAGRNLARLQETQENLAFLTRQFLGVEDFSPVSAPEAYAIDKQKLLLLPSPRRVLYDLLGPCGFTEDQARQIGDNLNNIGFLIHSNTGWTILCDRNSVLVEPPVQANQPRTLVVQKDDLMVRLGDGSTLFFMGTTSKPPYPDGTESVLIDATGVKYPLKVRHWRAGDSFQPFGMGGQKQKLQDFFTDRKLSLFEKRDVWLLINGDGAVIWVIGMRLDDRFQVRSNTLNGLKITWAKP